MGKDPAKDPSTRSRAYDAMLPSWVKVGTLLSGTSAMRKAGERYLPRHDKESSKNYQNRLERAVLYNKTDMVLSAWVGRPFSDPLVLEDVPAEVESLLDDVDLQGNHAQVFCRRWFKTGLAKAFCHVLVDFPYVDPTAPRTLADDRQQKLRPYWCLVEPENVIAMSSVVEQGVEYLTHVRILENEVAQNGFAERLIQRIRQFDRGVDKDGNAGVFVTMHELVKEGRKEVWKVVSGPTKIGIDVIPLVTYYADREALMLGKPPLEDLADLNIAHWQSSADQTNILTVTRFPLLAQAGASPDGSDEGEVQIGPRKLLFTTDPSGRFYYVEHSGAAISAGREDLKDLEDAMGDYGADFLRKQPGTETATAKALDSVEATSPLQDQVIRFNDALAQVMDLTGRWMNLEETGKVEANVEFGPEVSDASDLQALAAARAARDISRETHLHELKRRAVLDDTFDPVKNAQQLAKEGMEFGGEPQNGPIDDAQ